MSEREEYVSARTLFGMPAMTDKIVAILKGREEVERAMERLLKAGVGDKEIRHVSGPEVLDRYKKALQQRSVLETLRERFAKVFDTYEVDLVKHYIAAAEHGSEFLVIYAPNEERIEKVRAALDGDRKVDMHHYGQLAITNLS